MMHKLPKTLPGDWIAAVRQPASDGCYRGYIVVREHEGFDKFQVHNAYYKDEGEQRGWNYAQGDYVHTLEEAMGSFIKRSGLTPTVGV